MHIYAPVQFSEEQITYALHCHETDRSAYVTSNQVAGGSSPTGGGEHSGLGDWRRRMMAAWMSSLRVNPASFRAQRPDDEPNGDGHLSDHAIGYRDDAGAPSSAGVVERTSE